MIVFAVELLNLFILFRYVLGYEFRKTRIPIAIGVILIAIDCWLRITFSVSMTYEIDYLFTAISMILPVCFC